MLQVTIAPLWRRFAAMFYDSLILLAISMAYGAVVTALGAILLPPAEQDYQPMFEAGTLKELVTLGWLCTLVLFFSFFWHKSGQTVGMKAWRIQIVDVDHPSHK